MNVQLAARAKIDCTVYTNLWLLYGQTCISERIVRTTKVGAGTLHASYHLPNPCLDGLLDARRPAGPHISMHFRSGPT
jgi:hypothetical protein